MSPASALAMALLASNGGSYFCQASERIEPGTWAVFQSVLLEDGGGKLPSFHIRYTASIKEAISQSMEWYDVPRWNAHLGAPDTISFSVPISKPDRRGFLRFGEGAEGWAVPQQREFIHALTGFGLSWVEFQGHAERNKFWSGSGWKVEAVDRRRRVMGSTRIRMPGPERVEQAYTRLRADLIKFEADPAKHCKYSPAPEFEDDPGAIVRLTGSGSSGPA
ncbi:MAG TPA: hypothetical protein VF548_15145 [Allosphingosinicella sp.]|jgi:hypothetical protein